MNFEVREGKNVQLPLFIPVYRPDFISNKKCLWGADVDITAIMVNAFFLYKKAEIREKFIQGLTLSEHIGGFDGMLCTDSGAFQALGKKPLYLKNSKIVWFQNLIKTDIAAPLDRITPPWDNRTTAEKKLKTTQKNTAQAMEMSEYSTIAGIQQGGKFFDLRQKAIRDLEKLGTRYYGIGSLVPFFNKEHNMSFVAKVIKDAREVIGERKPMHIYGAGDPFELPFMAYWGANIFDSSSYNHYANGGYYMTPYAAIQDLNILEVMEYKCDCSVCANNDIADVFADVRLLSKHNLLLIYQTIENIRDAQVNGNMKQMLNGIIAGHNRAFPESLFEKSIDGFMD